MTGTLPPPKAKHLGILIALGAMAFVAWQLLWDADDGKSAQHSTQPALAAPPVAAPPASGGSTHGVSNAASLGGSLEDAARMFDLGVAGDLRLNLNAKAALDIIQFELGSHPSDADLKRLEVSLRSGLPPTAASEALALVQSYRSFNQALDAQMQGKPAPSTVEEMQALLKTTQALRTQHLGASASQALFGMQDAHTRYALEAQSIESDPGLAASEKARRIQDLQRTLPADVKAMVVAESSAVTNSQALEQDVARLRAQGASDDQIHQLRERTLGAEGAQALAQMDEQRLAWDSRYKAFAEQKRALIAGGQMPDPGQLDALMRQHFSAEELPAAQAYHRVQNPEIR